MKAIQIIAKYGVEKYMPWFEQHILGGEGDEAGGEGDKVGGEEDEVGGEGGNARVEEGAAEEGESDVGKE
jgi:hypothetical protein